MNASSDTAAVTRLVFPGTAAGLGLFSGAGIAAGIGQRMRDSTGAERVLVLADPALTGMGVLEPLLGGLQRAGLAHAVFDAIAPEPGLEHVKGAVAAAQEFGADAMIGVGGGSVMDVAKVAALALGTKRAPEHYLLPPAAPACPGSLPLALVPSTAGTGSEVSIFAVITCDGVKRSVVSGHIVPPLAFLDPELTVSMPAPVTAATGADAVTHAVEALMHSGAGPLNTALSAGALTLISRALPRAVEQPDDLAARSDMLIGAAMAMASFNLSGGLWAHSVSYVLSQHYKAPHGLGCALGLPALMRYNADGARDALETVRRAMDPGAPDAASAVEALFRRIGIPRNLHALGVTEDRLQALSAEMTALYPRPANPLAMSPEQAHGYWRAMFAA